MRVGTKSLLFGVHQFIWHPFTVYLAWTEKYGRPTLKETLCIIVHDWGYWGMPNMDGEEGVKHPDRGALIAKKLLGEDYFMMCIAHSRDYSKRYGVEPSKLCWADKLSIKYDPKWFYLLRARLSGELKEYRSRSHREGEVHITEPDSVWFDYLCKSFKSQGTRQACSTRLTESQMSA